MIVDKTLAIPYIFIIVLFPLTLIPGFIHIVWLRYLFCVLFLGIFILYLRLMYRRRIVEPIEEVDDLIFTKFTSKLRLHQMIVLAIQLLVGVVLLYFGSRYLVSSVASVSQSINVSPLGLAVIIIPAATAIPETITALIWGYRGKDTLSIGSLVGEKVLYSTFYPAIGLFLTSWVLDIHAIFSVIVTTIISSILVFYIWRQKLPWFILLFGLAFFVAYGVLTFIFRI